MVSRVKFLNMTETLRKRNFALLSNEYNVTSKELFEKMGNTCMAVDKDRLRKAVG